MSTSGKKNRELFAILDTETYTFWFSGMNRIAYSTVGTAKTAFASSARNPLRCKFSEQTRFKIVRVHIAPEGIVADVI